MTELNLIKNAFPKVSALSSFDHQVTDFISSPQRMLGAHKKAKKLVFRENIWGVWENEEFKFDAKNYGIVQWLDFLKAKWGNWTFISDTVIEYYSDGSRRLVAVKPKMLGCNERYWNSKNEYSRVKDWANLRQVLKLFPDDPYLQKLAKKYPYLLSKGRFRLSKDLDNYELAMPIAEAQWIYFDKDALANRIWRILCWPTLGNLQLLFAMYSKIIRENKDVSQIDQMMAENAIISRICHKNYSKSCKLYVGYAVPYNVAVHMTENSSQLRREYLDHGEPLNISLGGQVISKKNCNDFDSFDEDCGITSGNLIFEPEVYFEWGAEFTPTELSFITRERDFRYFNPDLPLYTQQKNMKEVLKKRMPLLIFAISFLGILLSGLIPFPEGSLPWSISCILALISGTLALMLIAILIVHLLCLD